MHVKPFIELPFPFLRFANIIFGTEFCAKSICARISHNWMSNWEWVKPYLISIFLCILRENKQVTDFHKNSSCSFSVFVFGRLSDWVNKVFKSRRMSKIEVNGIAKKWCVLFFNRLLRVFFFFFFCGYLLYLFRSECFLYFFVREFLVYFYFVVFFLSFCNLSTEYCECGCFWLRESMTIIRNL